MSTIEYAQRLLNAGELEEAELEGILQGRVTEQALRLRGKKVDVDTHPARTAMLMVTKAVKGLGEETRYYADFVELFVASLERFLHLSCILSTVPVSQEELAERHHVWGVAQHITGDVSIVDGILAKEPVFLALASKYAGFEITEMNDDAIDALEEFINVVNGLYIVELANHKMEPDLEYPRAAENVIPHGSQQLALRVYTEVGSFLLVLSTDAFL